MSDQQTKIDGIATEVIKSLMSVHDFNSFNVSQRGLRRVLKIIENNPDVTLKDVFESLHDRLDK